MQTNSQLVNSKANSKAYCNMVDDMSISYWSTEKKLFTLKPVNRPTVQLCPCQSPSSTITALSICYTTHAHYESSPLT